MQSTLCDDKYSFVALESLIVNWCVEPSQPLRIIQELAVETGVTDNSSIDKAETSFERQEYFSQFQDATDALPCHIHLPV